MGEDALAETKADAGLGQHSAQGEPPQRKGA